MPQLILNSADVKKACEKGIKELGWELPDLDSVWFKRMQKDWYRVYSSTAAGRMDDLIRYFKETDKYLLLTEMEKTFLRRWCSFEEQPMFLDNGHVNYARMTNLDVSGTRCSKVRSIQTKHQTLTKQINILNEIKSMCIQPDIILEQEEYELVKPWMAMATTGENK